VTQYKANERVPPAPPLTLMSIKVQTILNHDAQQNEILSVSALIKTRVEVDGKVPTASENLQHFTIIRRLPAVPFPSDFEKLARTNTKANVFVEVTEKALLANLLGTATVPIR